MLYLITCSDTYVLGRGRLENIVWSNRVRNEEVLQVIKEEGNILHTIKRRKRKRIGHSWRRNCLLRHVIEGKTEGKN